MGIHPSHTDRIDRKQSQTQPKSQERIDAEIMIAQYLAGNIIENEKILDALFRSETERGSQVETTQPFQFASNGIPSTQDIRNLLKSSHGRNAFVHVLNLQRSLKTDVGSLFSDLVWLTEQLLDDAIVRHLKEIEFHGVFSFFSFFSFILSFPLLYLQEFQDVHAAKMMMVLSETFYYNPTVFDQDNADHIDGRLQRRQTVGLEPRKYVQDVVRRHRIWKSKNFWEQAVYDSISEEMAKTDEPNWKDLAEVKSFSFFSFVCFKKKFNFSYLCKCKG